MTNRNLPWSKEEDDFLRENYKELGPVCVGKKKLGRSKVAVYNHARRIGVLTQRENRRWSQEEEDDFLRENYATLGSNRVGERLNRTSQSIRHRARKLRLKESAVKHWTEDEYDFLRKNYQTFGTAYVSEALGRSRESVRQHASRLKLTSSSRWTEDEDDFLRKRYAATPVNDLVEKTRSNRTFREKSRTQTGSHEE